MGGPVLLCHLTRRIGPWLDMSCRSKTVSLCRRDWANGIGLMGLLTLCRFITKIVQMMLAWWVYWYWFALSQILGRWHWLGWPSVIVSSYQEDWADDLGWMGTVSLRCLIRRIGQMAFIGWVQCYCVILPRGLGRWPWLGGSCRSAHHNRSSQTWMAVHHSGPDENGCNDKGLHFIIYLSNSIDCTDNITYGSDI